MAEISPSNRSRCRRNRSRASRAAGTQAGRPSRPGSRPGPARAGDAHPIDGRPRHASVARTIKMAAAVRGDRAATRTAACDPSGNRKAVWRRRPVPYRTGTAEPSIFGEEARQTVRVLQLPLADEAVVARVALEVHRRERPGPVLRGLHRGRLVGADILPRQLTPTRNPSGSPGAAGFSSSR